MDSYLHIHILAGKFNLIEIGRKREKPAVELGGLRCNKPAVTLS